MTEPAYPRRTHMQVLLLCGLCLLCLLAYAPGIPGDYMFDDMPNLLHNQRLDMQTLDLASLQNAAWSSGAGPLQRPVSMASFAINRYFSGISPGSYKITNLVIHLLTGAGIFLLLRLLVAGYRRQRQPELSGQTEFWLPVIVTGLWLLHPLNLTPVLYIVQRMTSLAALFTVFGLCLYTLGRQRMLAGRPGQLLIIAGLVVCGGLATLSKETGVLIVPYMLVIEVALFRFRNGNGTTSRFVSGFFAVTLLVPLALFAYLLLTDPASVLNYASRDFTLFERVLTQTRVLVFYLKLIVLPTIHELGLYHDDIALSHGLFDPPATLYSALLLAALFAAGVALLRRRALAALGILWFFAGHALESTIFQLDIAYEHRNYLADMGIMLALFSLIAEQKITRVARLARNLVPVLFLLVFGYTTWLRADQWSNNVDHAIYEARHHPDSARAVFSAARIMARLALKGTPGAADRAYAYLDRSAQLDRAGILADTVRIKLSFLLDRPVDSGWYDNIVERIRNNPIRPDLTAGLNELGRCYNAGCDIPRDVMETLFDTALQNDSLVRLPHLHAELLTLYGYFAINKTGDFEKGRLLFEHALQLDPGEPQRWVNLVRLQIAMKHPEQARQTLDRLAQADIRGGVTTALHELQSEIDQLQNANDLQQPQSTETADP